MQIQKHTGASNIKSTSEETVKNAAAAKTQQQSQVSHFIKPALSFPRSISSLITSLNLPKDKLSANLLFLTRFFSLPIKPEQLNEIRRQAFTPAQENIKQALTEKLPDAVADKNRSALLLAAAAAESKGVDLSPRGLELYADAIDPEWEERQDANGQNKDRKNKDKDKQEESGTVNGIAIKKMTQESEENNPVLSILNKLPGKKNQRWIVLPFNFCQNGRAFRVSMRVLVDGDNAIFAALDIKETLGDIRYPFALEFANNKVNRITFYNEQCTMNNEEVAVKQELAALFDLPVECVCVKTGAAICEAGFGERLFRFIDEAV